MNRGGIAILAGVFSFVVHLSTSSIDVDAHAQIPQGCPSEKEAAKKGKEAKVAKNWEIAEFYYSCAFNKKQKPEYDKELQAIRTELANQRARDAEASLNKEDLKTCDERMAVPQTYPQTAELQQVRARFNQKVEMIKRQRDTLLNKAAEDPEASLNGLKQLSKYSYVLPELDADISKVTETWRIKLLAGAGELLARFQCEDASQQYQRALEIAPENQEARDGIVRAGICTEALHLYSQAQSQYGDQRYEEAKNLVDRAILTYSDGKEEFKKLGDRIIDDWLKYLLERIGSDPEKEISFENSLDKYLSLLHVQVLDPGAQVLEKLPAVRTQFAQASAEKAKEYKKERWVSKTDPAFLATAYLMLFNAQLCGASDAVRIEDLVDMVDMEDLFYRKRSTRVIVTVENTSVASSNFVDALTKRSRSILEGIGLQDLRIYARDEWEQMRKNCSAQNSRSDICMAVYDEPTALVWPDLKSPYIRISLEIDQFTKREKGQIPGPIQVIESKHIAGIIEVENPEYKDHFQKVKDCESFFTDPRNQKKKCNNIWTLNEFQIQRQKLNSMPQKIWAHDWRPYRYIKSELEQYAAINVRFSIFDHLRKERIVLKEIFRDKERKGFEITGAKEPDIDQPIAWQPAAEDLLDLQSDIGKELDLTIPALLKPYLDRFYAAGEQSLKNKRPEEAAENFLCHWAFYRGKVEEDVRLKAVRNTILQLTGFDLNKDGVRLVEALMKSHAAP